MGRSQRASQVSKTGNCCLTFRVPVGINEMSAYITGLTAGGAAWTPSFVAGIDQTRCIGCGRCFKVCPRDVFDLVERSEVLADDEIDDYEDLDEDNAQVMSIANALDCIGCEACSRVCPKSCFTHAPLSQAA